MGFESQGSVRYRDWAAYYASVPQLGQANLGFGHPNKQSAAGGGALVGL